MMTQGLSLEFYMFGRVYQPVLDGICKCRFCNVVIPSLQRQLWCGPFSVRFPFLPHLSHGRWTDMLRFFANSKPIYYSQVGGYAPFSPRKWLNHFFTHIHDYNEDYSSDLLELLPHNLKQKGILWHPLRTLQESWSVLQDFENISNNLEGTLQYGVCWWLSVKEGVSMRYTLLNITIAWWLACWLYQMHL